MARRFKTSGDVRRFLGDLIRRVEKNEVDPRKADCIIRACNALLISIRQDDTERRLERLEEIAGRAEGERHGQAPE